MIFGFNLARVFSFDYLFDLRPGAFQSSGLRILFVGFGLCLIAGLVARILPDKKKMIPPLKRFYAKVSHFLFTLAALGLLLIFFRQSQAYFLSTPFLLLLLALGAIAWTLYLVKFFMARYREEKSSYLASKEKEKYLP